MAKKQEILLSRRVVVSKEVMEKLQKVFADDPAKPLARCTISCDLNEERTGPKAVEIRELALALGGYWVRTIKEL